MSEELKKEDVKVVEDVKATKADTEVMPEAPKEPSETEAKAMEMGWNPDKQGVDPGKWIGAEEYIARAPLFEKNRKLSRKVKELESSVGALKEHYSRIEELAYEKALETLKEKKIKAMDEFDHKTVAAIDDQILDLKKKPATAQKAQTNEVFDEWREKNPWYEADEDMKEYADFVGVRYANKNEGASPESVYRHAEQKVREKYPEKFRNPNKERQSPVEGGTKAAPKSGRPTWSSLPEHFQQAGNKFVRNGIMTKDQYIDDLIKMGEIK